LIFPLHIKDKVVLRIAELFVVVTVQQLLAAVGASIFGWCGLRLD
jgi:hypothetical protein